MKIILKNFRCYTSKTFNFPDYGITLFSGESGKGKSTIFNAIQYCLYNSIKKPCSYNKNSCSVILYFKNITITRSTRPNTIKVIYNDIEYIDQEAQSVINSYFGDSTSFMICDYISQNNNSSILYLSPTEQKRVIESIAFTETDNYSLINNKIKERLQEVDNLLFQKRTEINTLETFILTDIPEKPIESIKKKSSEIFSEIKKYKEEYDKLVNELNRLNELINNIDEDIPTKIKILNEELNRLTYKDLSFIKNKIKDVQNHKVKREKYLSYLLKIKEYKTSLKKLKEEYIEERDIPFDLSKLKKDYIDSQRFLELKDINYKDIISSRGHKVKCWKCKEMNNIYKDNSYKPTENKYSDQDFENALFVNDFIKNKRDIISNKEYNKLIDEYNEIVENNKKSVLIKSQIKNLKKPEEIEFIEECNEDLDRLNKELNENEYENNKVISLKKELEKLNKKNVENNITSIKNKIKEKNIKKDELNEKINTLKDEYYSRKKYESDLEIYNKYSIKLEKLEESKKEFQNLTKRNNNLQRIYEISKSAHLISIEETINTINMYCMKYLSKLFEEGEMIVKLKTIKNIKSTKSTKFQINISIIYKGDECSLEDLSGGERQRVNLAFTLGMNEMMDKKILFLDECLNNLDLGNNNNSLNVIKDFSKNKGVYIISHEAVAGFFDHTINF